MLTNQIILTKQVLLDIINTYESSNSIINFGHKLLRLVGSHLLPEEIIDLQKLVMQFPDGELNENNRLDLKNHIESLPETHHEEQINIRKIYQAIKDKLKETERTPQHGLIYSALSIINFSLLHDQYPLVKMRELIACIEELTGLKFQKYILSPVYQPALDSILLGLLISIKREDIFAYLIAKFVIQPIGQWTTYLARKDMDNENYTAYLEPAINLLLPALLDYMIGFENNFLFGSMTGHLFQSVTTRMTNAFFDYANEWTKKYPNTKKLIESTTRETSYYLGMISGFSIYNYITFFNWQSKTNSINYEKSPEKPFPQKSVKCHSTIPAKLTQYEISELQSKNCNTTLCKETAYKALGLDSKGSYSKIDIKKAYQCRLLIFHPDKCSYPKETCTEQAALITNARNILQKI